MITELAKAVSDNQSVVATALAAMKDAETTLYRYRTALEMIANILNEDWTQGESAATLLHTCRGYAMGALGTFDNGVSIGADGMRKGL